MILPQGGAVGSCLKVALCDLASRWHCGILPPGGTVGSCLKVALWDLVSFFRQVALCEVLSYQTGSAVWDFVSLFNLVGDTNCGSGYKCYGTICKGPFRNHYWAGSGFWRWGTRILLFVV